MIAALPVLLGIIFLVLDHILTFGFYNGIKIINSVLDTITGAKSKTSRRIDDAKAIIISSYDFCSAVYCDGLRKLQHCGREQSCAKRRRPV